MKIRYFLAAAGLVAMVPMALTVPSALSQDGGVTVNSLRGDVDLPTTNAAPMVPKQDTNGRFARSYRQQPPMIPHRIRGYEIDAKVNKCMTCHDWPANVDYGAPKISETHYMSRDGVALDHVARTRWFCNQCHVPQANAKALVGNDFKSALDVE